MNSSHIEASDHLFMSGTFDFAPALSESDAQQFLHIFESMNCTQHSTNFDPTYSHLFCQLFYPSESLNFFLQQLHLFYTQTAEPAGSSMDSAFYFGEDTFLGEFGQIHIHNDVYSIEPGTYYLRNEQPLYLTPHSSDVSPQNERTFYDE